MNTPSKAQLAAILGAIALLVLLLFAHKTGTPDSTKKLQTAEHTGFSMLTYIDSVKKTLDKNALSAIQQQESISNSTAAFDSLSRIWTSLNQQAIGSWYLLQSAGISNTAQSWNNAGSALYKSARFAQEASRHFFMDQAIEAFNKALKIDSTLLETKVNLGICYVEGGHEPMKGIQLLREVVAKDSNNLNAQLNLGLFAVQSGQYEKAIDRFNKLLRINPQYSEAYLYLGQTYSNMEKRRKQLKH